MQGCICPHPPLLIPEVGGAARNKIAATVAAMDKLAASVGEPETIVVISPHADDFGSAHAVKTPPRLKGDFGRFRCPEAAFSYDNDVQFAELLLALAGDNRKLRVVPDDSEVLDWGVLVPLSFLRPIGSSACRWSARTLSTACSANSSGGAPKSSAATRCSWPRATSRTRLFTAPRRPTTRAASSSTTRSRACWPSATSPALTRIEPILLDGAAECGLRSFVALGGFLGDDATVDPEILNYEGPYGVGYLVARFGPRPHTADATA